MNFLRKDLPSCIGALMIVAVSAFPSLADDMGGMNGMSGMSSGMESPSSGSIGHGKGVITAIDRTAGTVTIRHGPIKAFGWNGMTMSFPVEHVDAIRSLNIGEHVRFDVVKKGDGSFAISTIRHQ